MSRPSTSPSLLWIAAFALAGTAACQGQPSSLDSADPICSEGSCDEPVPPISGRSLVECWVQPAGTGDNDRSYDTLDCRYTAPLVYPIALDGAFVRATSAEGAEFDVFIDKAHEGRIVSMAHLKESAFPIELEMNIRFDPTDRSVEALEGLEQVTTRVTLDTPETASPLAPASADIPFDLWQVNMFGRDSEFSAISMGYNLDVGDDRPFLVQVKTKPLFFGHTSSFYLPVSPETFALESKLVFEGGDSSIVAVTGPGNYVVKDRDLYQAEAPDLPRAAENSPTAIASCFMPEGDHGFRALSCRSNALAGIDPDSAILELVTDKGTKRFDLSSELTKLVDVSPQAFPLTMVVRARVDGEDIVGLQELVGDRLQTERTVEYSQLENLDAGLYFKAPYELWSVTIDNQAEGFSGQLEPYVLELGDQWSGQFAELVDGAETGFVAEGEQRTLRVATSPGQHELAGTGVMVVAGQETDVDFVLRPGTLVVGE